MELRKLLLIPIAGVLSAMLILCIGVGNVFADDGATVKIDKKNFPSEGIRNYVLKYADKNSDKKLSAAEMKAVKKIRPDTEDSVKTLKGIEFFSELEEIICDSTEYDNNHSIEEADFSKNPKLKKVVLMSKFIPKLDFSQNPDLVSLDIDSYNESQGDYSECKEINLSNCKKLKFLRFGNSSVEKMDLSDCVALEELYCPMSVNLKTLDLSKNTNLKKVECGGEYDNRYLHNLNLKNCSKLEELMCGCGKLETLDLSDSTNLKVLNCNDNKLKSLVVSTMPKLRKLSFSGNRIEEIDLSGNKELTNLSFDGNRISKLNIKNLKNLKKLSCKDNKLKSLDVKKNKALKVIYASGNKLKTIKSKKVGFIGCSWSSHMDSTQVDFWKITKQKKYKILGYMVTTQKGKKKRTVEIHQTFTDETIHKPDRVSVRPIVVKKGMVYYGSTHTNNIWKKRVKIKKAKSKKRAIYIKWKNAKCSYYQIILDGKKIYKTKKTSITIKKLKKGKAYYLSVRPVKKTKGKLYYGGTISTKYIRVK